MPKSSLNVSLKGADDIFSTEESRQEEKREQVQQIPIGELFPFKNHPFKVLDDETMQRTVESVKQLGVTNPLIARPRPEGGYEIISGHRRQHVAQLAGLNILPVIVRQMDDDAAILLMVDSNLQRESILPSERAFAYKMKLEALKNQGARSDLTSAQIGPKLTAAEKVAEEANDTKSQVKRFIRLANLIPELLNMVDEKKISFNPAVELSYLDTNQQRDFLEAMQDTQNAPSLSQAQHLKKLAQEGRFSYDAAFAVMGEPKKDELDKVVIKNDTLRKYFPRNYTPKQMEDTVARALVVVAGYMGSGNVPLMLLFTAVAALGQGPWQGDMNAVIAACSEYTWLTKHKRVDGTMYSCTSLGVKLGGGLGTAITGWLLAASHFDSVLAVQPESCISMLKIMYLVIPFA